MNLIDLAAILPFYVALIVTHTLDDIRIPVSPAGYSLVSISELDACAICAGDEDDDEQHVAGLIKQRQRQLGEQYNREARILAGPIRPNPLPHVFL